MDMESIIKELGIVPLASNTGERIYMREFRKEDGLPFDLARWQPTVDAMLSEVDTDGPIYLMVDQALVSAGAAHRRPGVHIDGYWHPALHAHGTPTPSPGHSGQPPAPTPGRHIWAAGGHGHIIRNDDTVPEGLILASDVAACRAFVGQWEGAPGEGGDCRHIDLSGLHPVILQSGIAYAGNVAMLHESLPVPLDCLRTVVRLNVPGWTPR
jgi:hypothetical protein